MADIRLNSRRLYEAARRLRQIRSHIDEEKNQLHHLQSEIQDHWISDSRATYLDGVEKSETNLRTLSRRTEQLARRLEQLAKTAERIERENAASFGRGGSFSGGGGYGGGSGGGGGRSW